VLGNEVITTKKTTIDISTLANGVYFINLKTSEGLLSKKLVVQH
jgi:type IX secretion system substrate protein